MAVDGTLVVEGGAPPGSADAEAVGVEDGGELREEVVQAAEGFSHGREPGGEGGAQMPRLGRGEGDGAPHLDAVAFDAVGDAGVCHGAGLEVAAHGAGVAEDVAQAAGRQHRAGAELGDGRLARGPGQHIAFAPRRRRSYKLGREAAAGAS